MKGLILRWLISTASIMLASYLVDGIRVSGFFSALSAAVALGILNAVLRPVLIILTLPLTILTMGLFIFFINALMLLMASGIIPGFDVQGFWPAVFGSLIISIINWILSMFINEQGKVEYIELNRKGKDRWG
ncbi:MAG: phage holin family protein [Deltaproteobacteria bacterium]|nr:phage holin family protein [Deltaproteobacteria bacterium]